MALLTYGFDPRAAAGFASEAAQIAGLLQRQHQQAQQTLDEQARVTAAVAAEREKTNQALLQASLASFRRDFEFRKQEEFQSRKLVASEQDSLRDFGLKSRELGIRETEAAPFSFSPGSPASAAVEATRGADMGALGRITDYGQADDPTPDSLTRAGKSAIGDLRPDSLAVSRDVEAKLNAQGVKIGSPVVVALDDGTKMTRFWDDRTAAVFQGKPLTGRVDLYSPEGPSPVRGKAVVDIAPVEQPSAAKNFARDIVEMQKLGVPPTVKAVRQALPNVLSASAYATGRAQAKATAPDKPIVRNFPDGSARQWNPQEKDWDVVATKPEDDKPIVRNFADDTTRQFDRESGTWVTLAEKKEGPPKIKFQNVEGQGVYAITEEDGEIIKRLVIPKAAKLTDKESTKYQEVLAKARDTTLKAKELKDKGPGWMNFNKGKIDKAEADALKAAGAVKDWFAAHPELRAAAEQASAEGAQTGGAPPEPAATPPAPTQNQAALDWLAANPDDPRAPAVRAKLGLK